MHLQYISHLTWSNTLVAEFLMCYQKLLPCQTVNASLLSITSCHYKYPLMVHGFSYLSLIQHPTLNLHLSHHQLFRIFLLIFPIMLASNYQSFQRLCEGFRFWLFLIPTYQQGIGDVHHQMCWRIQLYIDPWFIFLPRHLPLGNHFPYPWPLW